MPCPEIEIDRERLFGVVALRTGLVAQASLAGAIEAREERRPLGEVLVERGALDRPGREMIDSMVELLVASHGGDASATLEALGPESATLADLGRTPAQLTAIDSLATVVGPLDSLATVAPTHSDVGGSSHSGPLRVGTRYRKLREHARGGLGVVFVARDEELNRDVALKEIQDRHADHPHHRSKFLLEAEVTGGLEHPGIVPVHGLGCHEDGRPYYAMRFIKGESLKEAINAFHADKALEGDPGARTLALQKLLRRFTDACNAIDYAHSRGVLHRDLKPQNVMVGPYGETLVVDWGLAKTLGRGPETDEAGAVAGEGFRSASSEGSVETLPGSLIGTPAYMSPEQAAGRLDLLGPASDIYGLGATLYHLLSGKPPLGGGSLGEMLAKVQAGDFARPRASSPWLDPALEAICLKAMALKPEGRYATARALADDVDRWIAGEPVAAYPEPFARRARRWAGRHRTSLATASATVVVAALLFGGVAWQRFEQRRATDGAALAILAGAEHLASQARASGDLPTWEKAIAETLRARERLESGGGGEPLRREAVGRLTVLRADMAERVEALASEARDRRVVSALEEARLRAANENVKDGYYDMKEKLAAYLEAFRAYGIDPASRPVEESAWLVRSSRVADDLIAALDDWARNRPKEASVPAQRLESIIRLGETDPARASVREAVSMRDAPALRKLVEGEAARRRLGSGIRLAFDSLLAIDPAGSLATLKAIVREHPSDFWLNNNLGTACLEARPPIADDAVHYLSVAVALRPNSPGVHYNLGGALRARGRLDDAIDEYRAATRLDPSDARAFNNLGLSLRDRSRPVEAVEACRAALRIRPGYHQALINLGNALADQGKLEEAIEQYQAAIRARPDSAPAHANLGVALRGLGRVAEAVEAYRVALRLDPGDSSAQNNLGVALRALGRREESVKAFRAAVRLAPTDAVARNGLGVALGDLGKLDEAIAEHREAIRLKPDYVEAHTNLGNALQSLGRYQEAAEECRVAAKLNPDDPIPHLTLGLILLEMEKFSEALSSLEQGHALGSKRPNWRVPSETWVRDARRTVELEGRFRAILQGEAAPRDAVDRLELAGFADKTGRHATSTRLRVEAFAESPALADDLAKGYRCQAAKAASLAASGRGRGEPTPDDSAKAKLREQALAWLRDDLAAWGKLLGDGVDPARRRVVLGKLQGWKADGGLAGIRDESALAKWPESEREAFRAFWADVDTLLAKARAGLP